MRIYYKMTSIQTVEKDGYHPGYVKRANRNLLHAYSYNLELSIISLKTGDVRQHVIAPGSSFR
jgi:hypothetical protein